MGYEIPAANGAYYAKKQTIYCIAGDVNNDEFEELALLLS